MPVLISNYQKNVTVNRLKQTYSQILQGIRMVSNEDFGGSGIGSWSCPGASYVDSKGQSGCFQLVFDKIAGAHLYPAQSSYDKAACYIEGKPYIPYKYRNGSEIPDGKYISSASRSASLPNGACVIFHRCAWAGDARGTIVIDINGSYNGPNMFGKDVFMFNHLVPNTCAQIRDGLGIYPTGAYAGDGYTSKKRAEIKNNCNKRSGGNACAALIMYDGWHISRDYPW